MSIYNFLKNCIISFCISTNQNHMQNNISTDDEYDENEEEDPEETDMIIVQIETITIQIKYSQLCKHSQLIRERYLISDAREQLSSKIQEYQQNHQISDNDVSFFFRRLKDENIDISSENYRSFSKLAEFFKAKKIIKFNKNNNGK